MPLVTCPDCGKQVSDQAAACIDCGRPIKVVTTAVSDDVIRPILVSILWVALFLAALFAHWLISLAIIVGTCLWVHTDIKAIGVRKGLLTGPLDMPRWQWLVCCWGFWIIGFPVYLLNRQRLREVAGKARS